MKNRTQLTLALMTLLSTLLSKNVRADNTINCSDDQISRVETYQAYAGLQLLTASSYIGRVKNGDDPTRFDYWFGNHDEDTVNQVENIMKQVYYLALGDATYDCTCGDPRITPSVVAYVYPSDTTHHVHLCSPFFNASDDDINTWVIGVVTHELSHFYGTLDAPYPNASLPNSPEAAHQLAVSDPATAANDAYNYQFFMSNAEQPIDSTMPVDSTPPADAAPPADTTPPTDAIPAADATPAADSTPAADATPAADSTPPAESEDPPSE
jgi:hypothetical protein